MSHIAEYIEQAKLMLKAPILTGFDFLDNIMGGYYPGQVTTICGGENIVAYRYIAYQLKTKFQRKLDFRTRINNVAFNPCYIVGDYKALGDGYGVSSREGGFFEGFNLGSIQLV